MLGRGIQFASSRTEPATQAILRNTDAAELFCKTSRRTWKNCALFWPTSAKTIGAPGVNRPNALNGQAARV